MDQMPDHPQHHHAPKPGEATDPPAAHGMAVIGGQAVYLSHLPMFMSPHHYQVILEVEFEGDGNPQEVYFGDREKHPEQRLYTFNPVAFVLPSLFPDGEGPPEATSFRGTLHRGHFERQDTHPVTIAADVTVHVNKVIHQHKFESNVSELPELRYHLFGRGAEIFLAHAITTPPDFDQLLSVGIDTEFSDEAPSKGIAVRLEGRPNTVAARIKPGAEPELPAVAEIDGRSQPIRLRPKVEYYFEAGELADAM
jgi:hypothetical protein